MFNSFIEEAEEIYKGKMFLSMDDVTGLLRCDQSVIYNWTRRQNVKKRPPRINVGKEIRFPKLDFFEWLVQENSSGL